MFASPLRCCGPIKNINGALAIGTNNMENIGRIVSSMGRVRFASDKGGKESCCKDLPQTAGRKVEDWPKQEPVTQTPWRTECSRDPQPPNYDPYRIKVPEVVVPPLPPTNAKWTLLTSTDQRDQNQAGPGAQYGQGQYGHGHGQFPTQEQQEDTDTSLLAKLKGFFDKIRGKSKGGDDAMIVGQ